MDNLKYLDSYLYDMAYKYRNDKYIHMRTVTDLIGNQYENSFTLSELLDKSADEIKRLRKELDSYDYIKRILEIDKSLMKNNK